MIITVFMNYLNSGKVVLLIHIKNQELMTGEVIIAMISLGGVSKI